jgi:hypothetical protein
MRPMGRPGLADALRQQIVRRSGGRIHQLAVSADEARITVRGWARAFYHKQLAIQACLEVIGESASAPLCVEIEVRDGQPALTA